MSTVESDDKDDDDEDDGDDCDEYYRTRMVSSSEAVSKMNC